MLGLPPEVCANGPGQGGCPLGPDTGMEAWGHNTSELGKQAIQGINTNKVHLPTLHYAGPVLKKGQGSGIF